MNCFLSYCFTPGQQHLKKKQSALQKLPCKGKKGDALITSQAIPADVGCDVAQDFRALAETSNGVCIPAPASLSPEAGVCVVDTALQYPNIALHTETP